MGLNQRLVDHMSLYRSLASKEPKIVNDLVDSSDRDRENLNRLIYTTYDGDLLSNIPMCECGEVVGGYNEGTVCMKCDTEVKVHVERTIEPIAWIRAPNGVDTLMSPIAWLVFRKRFIISGFEVIRWLCDTDYSPPVKYPDAMKEIEALGIKRGYNYFCRNFDRIMEALLNTRAFRKRGALGDPMRQFITEYRDRIFTKYLPIPNKMLFVVEETNFDRYADAVTPIAINAVRMLVGVDKSIKPLQQRTIENRTVKALALLGEFNERFFKDTLATKEGVYRKNTYATRCHFCCRAVISSVTDEHNYEGIEIPWSAATSFLRIHLVSKLRRRGYTARAAIDLIDSHAMHYSPILDEIFKELISESRWGGIPATIVRHPSLGRGSIQAVFIVKIKPDPDDTTIGLPITITKAFNASNQAVLLATVRMNLSNCWKPSLGLNTTARSNLKPRFDKLRIETISSEASY